ncbi:MAG: 30S ribosomal protein S15 [Candidatus Marsarchaeota archaeon]|nr:30S ribosomal protein S15 [Candidatus Marsarchaeota archaeon]
MSRIHGKGKGKSKSRKPAGVEIGKIPSSASATKEEIEELIVKYTKQGMSPAMIGERLKKEHSVPYIRQYTGKRLNEILEERKMAPEIPSDLMDLMKTAVGMHAHLTKNTQDKYNAVRLKMIESKIWRLSRYYVREGRLPKGWKYDPQQAELLIKGKA